MSSLVEPIPQCDPRAAYLEHAARIDAAISSVLSRGRYVLGPEVSAFESEFATYLGVAHSVGLANGTDALELALRAVGVAAGDAVVTVSHTAVATVAAIRAIGARPVFVDVMDADGLMDPARLEDLLDDPGTERIGSGGIRAVVPVHLYGRAANIPAICAIASKHGLPVVEDCAQAHGARCERQRTGSLGSIAAFSFYPTKNLGAIGDGGAVASDNPRLIDQVRLLRQYGWRERYVSEVEGGNSRLDELQAAILRVKLPSLDADNARRAEIARKYRSSIENPDVTISFDADDGHVYHQFTVRTRHRESLQRHLHHHGIGTLIHYPCPVHLQPAYRTAHTHSLPNTERWSQDVLSLPMFPQLRDDQVERVVLAINEWCPERR